MNHLQASLASRGVTPMRSSGIVVGLALALLCLLAAGTSTAHASTVFSRSAVFGAPGTGPGELANPQRVALRTSTGQLFVADRDNDRVQVFATATNTVSAQFGGQGTTDDPVGVAVDQASGDVYVAGSASGTITKWSDSGLGYTQDLLFTSPAANGDPVAAGQVGSFASPLAIDPTTGDLLIGDVVNQRVERFSDTGTHLSDFDGGASPGGQAFSQIKDIATDASGDTFVVDGGRTVRFNADGSYDATLDVVDGPAFVAIDPSTGDPVVATNSDDPCSPERVNVYDGTRLGSSVAIEPVGGDCDVFGGLAFSAGGLLYASGFDVCGGFCGGASNLMVLSRDVIAADVTIDPATAVQETTARLHGTIDPNGASVIYHFEYSTDGGANWTPTPDQGPLTGASATAVQMPLSGLTAGTAYVYRLVAADGAARVYTLRAGFTTVDADPPSVVLDPVQDLNGSSFTVHATLNAHGYATRYKLEYSKDQGVTWIATGGDDFDPGTDSSIGALNTDVAISQNVFDNFRQNQTVAVRLTATSLIGTTEAQQSIVIPGSGATLGEGPVAINITDTSVKLRANVDPNSVETTYHFEYGEDSSYGNATPDASAGSADVEGPVSQTVTGLAPSTTYHYKVVVDNGVDVPAESADQTFTTADAPPTVATGGVSAITSSSADISGTVDNHDHAGTVQAAITQVDGAYSELSAAVSVAAVDGPQTVTVKASGLPVGGTFRVRLTASTSGGLRAGEEIQFSTSAPAGYQPPADAPAANGDWFASLPAPPVPPAEPSNVFTVTSKVSGTTAVLTVGVPGEGTLTVKGRRLGTAIVKARQQGSVKVTVRLTKAGRAALRRSTSRKLAVRVTVRFTPVGGRSRDATRTLTFKRKASR